MCNFFLLVIIVIDFLIIFDGVLVSAQIKDNQYNQYIVNYLLN